MKKYMVFAEAKIFTEVKADTPEEAMELASERPVELWELDTDIEVTGADEMF